MQIRLQVQVVRGPERPRGRRRRLLLLAAGLLAAVGVATPFALSAARIVGFSDVPPSNPNHDAIDRVTDAGIMYPCQTSPSLLFCPKTALGRQWAAANYDRMLGLSGTPLPYTPTFRAVNVQTGGSTPPFTVDSSQMVTNLNADQLDGLDAADFVHTVTVRSKEDTIFVNTIGTVQADCDPGSRATGGGGELVAGNAAQVNWIDTGVPVGDPPTGWRMKLLAPTANSQTIRVWVICVS
jgi:hypothetical protein